MEIVYRGQFDLIRYHNEEVVIFDPCEFFGKLTVSFLEKYNNNFTGCGDIMSFDVCGVEINRVNVFHGYYGSGRYTLGNLCFLNKSLCKEVFSYSGLLAFMDFHSFWGCFESNTRSDLISVGAVNRVYVSGDKAKVSCYGDNKVAVEFKL